MRFVRRSAILFAMALAVNSCSVNPGFNQFDLLVRWSKYKTKAEIEAQLWTVKIGDYQETVIPVTHDGFMTFYAKDGTEIEFQGWDVTALRNWNHYGKSIEIVRSGASLQHQFLDGSGIRLECSLFETDEQAPTKGGALNVSKCRDVQAMAWSYSNAVVMDEQGRAIWMLHHVAENMPPIELRLDGANIDASLSLQSFLP